MARSMGFIFALLGFHPVLSGWERTAVPADFVMPKPLPLEESIQSFQIRPGLKVELVASEPLVMDPVNLDFGPDGKLWVVEMADYPLGMDGKGKAGGRVRFLEDKDRDGEFESSTLFLDGLNFPTGVKVWRDGVLIVACPEILFVRDTDGDGKADHREVLFRGFREGNQQHRVNGFVWGLDNWLHLANGDSGGTIESVKTGRKLELGSFDLKINPDTGEMKLTSGRTQYGRVRDDYGNWFGNNNSKPLWQYVIKKEVMDLNPHVVYKDQIHMVPEEPRAPRIFPTAKIAHRFNNPNSASRITSACGISIMRDDDLGRDLYGNAFICEPVHNLVHRQVLKRDGLVFHGIRAIEEKDSEFFTSTDQWFRPVASVTGPDGALWVVDMHRFVIEHPEWIPQPWQKVLDLRAGDEMGRIYRIVPESRERKAFPDFSEMSTTQLVGKLSSKNGWERDMAHQLLIWKDVDTLDDAFMDGAFSQSVLGRIHHLSLLSRKGGVPGILLYEAMRSESPELQRFALSVARKRQINPAVLGEIVKLIQSDHPMVRYEAAVCLGRNRLAPEALSQFAVENADSPYLKMAIAPALVHDLDSIAQAVADAKVSSHYHNIIETAVATGNQSACQALLAADSDFAFPVLLSVLDRRRVSFESYLEKANDELRKLMEEGLSKRRGLADDILKPTIPDSRRIEAIACFGRVPASKESDIAWLVRLLKPDTSLAVSEAAVKRLIRLRDFGFLDHWNALSPSLRGTIVEHAFQHTDCASSFLDKLDRGEIPVDSVPVAARQKLLKHWKPEIKARSESLLGNTDGNREQVVRSYSAALEIEGDPKKGKTTFGLLCSTCHQLEGKGNPLGPDLSALTDTSSPALLTAILDPNRAVEDKYLLQVVTLKDKTVLSGMIASESGGSISLLSLDGKNTSVPRSEIAEIKNTGRSAMLEGLEGALDHQEMADLIAYLQSI